MSLSNEMRSLLSTVQVELPTAASAQVFPASSPVTGEQICELPVATIGEVSKAIDESVAAFMVWRSVPAPKRGELIRLFGEELRANKKELGRIISVEVGKVISEGQGEVQEMIDICDFAVGLSRQLYGLTIATERPDHRIMENWHPLGPVGIITAFNFPMAVWSWNAVIALVCGNSVIWKPSEKSSLSAIAAQAMMERAMKRYQEANGPLPKGLVSMVLGLRDIGEALVESPKVPLISATGSTMMGRQVGMRVAHRFGRSILELGGNNAAIVTPSADLDITVRAAAFAAMGTAGQRCTTLRRLFVHESVYETIVTRLKAAYSSIKVGSPLEDGTLVGPLIDRGAFHAMQHAIAEAKAIGGTVTGGERVSTGADNAYYARPALIEMPVQDGPMLHETFAPVLYVLKYSVLDEAIALNNSVSQGLSSAIFTLNMRETETFLSVRGSDCGIVNVNIGPSGAEIGGAFGGEKETGGSRECGSDAWRGYMRRATNTINYGTTLPLAQGVEFNV
ncbi:L-piperidine-6-carboxylate dehydrogenase [Mesorhizobium escarrei]|uniref:aldehyde dehydrogenase (NAD(+)) n=1 Tax=Mesorhizobium escarrei TaxID=666018 RepID=A0ABM9E651_9HYPH|nr:aldehyde dehydrogenase family protein [Mesorhizobium escarrei]CAH2404600.1 Aldehyde dehydrogenase family protein [Mesorhizobium escarrei]